MGTSFKNGRISTVLAFSGQVNLVVVYAQKSTVPEKMVLCFGQSPSDTCGTVFCSLSGYKNPKLPKTPLIGRVACVHVAGGFTERALLFLAAAPLLTVCIGTKVNK